MMHFGSFFKGPKQIGVRHDACADVKALLSLYSDHMTSAAESRRVEAHLEECEDCRKAHFWMKATYEVLSHRPVVLPPPDMASRIRQAIAESEAGTVRPVRVRFNPRPAYAFAASLLVTAVVAGSLHLFDAHSTGGSSVGNVNAPLSPVASVPLPVHETVSSKPTSDEAPDHSIMPSRIPVVHIRRRATVTTPNELVASMPTTEPPPEIVQRVKYVRVPATHRIRATNSPDAFGNVAVIPSDGRQPGTKRLTPTLPVLIASVPQSTPNLAVSKPSAPVVTPEPPIAASTSTAIAVANSNSTPEPTLEQPKQVASANVKGSGLWDDISQDSKLKWGWQNVHARTTVVISGSNVPTQVAVNLVYGPVD